MIIVILDEVVDANPFGFSSSDQEVIFGGGAKKGFNEEYRETKEKYGIITTLA